MSWKELILLERGICVGEADNQNLNTSYNNNKVKHTLLAHSEASRQCLTEHTKTQLSIILDTISWHQNTIVNIRHYV